VLYISDQIKLLNKFVSGKDTKKLKYVCVQKHGKNLAIRQNKTHLVMLLKNTKTKGFQLLT
jgi:hypothetical protein